MQIKYTYFFQVQVQVLDESTVASKVFQVQVQVLGESTIASKVFQVQVQVHVDVVKYT